MFLWTALFLVTGIAGYELTIYSSLNKEQYCGSFIVEIGVGDFDDGQQGVTAIEIAKQIASGNVKVTPDILVQGDGNIGGLLSPFLTILSRVNEKLK